MCARMFDEPPLRPLASRVTRVSLVQASEPGAALGAEGLLLVGWLATCLGWKTESPAREASKLTLVRADGGHVEVVTGASATSKAPRHALLAVRIEASADDVTMRGEIAREPGDADAATWRLEVTRSGAEPERIEQHVRLRATETAGLLQRTLHRPTVDAALADSAAWADGLSGEELACGGDGDNVRA
jgi:glucose-6-phosphate dehydrogenase assembly protein OpcA